MIYFFGNPARSLYAVQTSKNLDPSNQEKLVWLFGNQTLIDKKILTGSYVGPRATMITPWSTNAVEITQNMDIDSISRIEMFVAKNPQEEFDPMLYEVYDGLDQSIFDINITPEPIRNITDIEAYNQKEGLALNNEEVDYLEGLSQSLGRPLTDSEVFGFSQVNSEHCRHKIFNGRFVIDGKEQEESLFQMIKKTSKTNPNSIVSAYKDNVAFVSGPEIEQFAPQDGSVPSVYQTNTIKSVISLKAETHNFPTTVEPFNGAATGSGGEIRDRLAGGQGSLPLAGTAVYMTPYSRVATDRKWEEGFPERKWLYQTPLDLLIKASNGASDFGNKFGQPLISGSVLTFEHQEKDQRLGYDKVIMMAGGVGYGVLDQAQKKMPSKGDIIVILGGDNYRIGMGGAAVSSANTGAFSNEIELNAVQRSNPEMQKRAANAIRALVESAKNPIISIHDHGAGGHLNCLSELVEDTGGIIHINELPLGDPTLSAKEIIGNESQERMGLILSKKDARLLETIAQRERAPFYIVGQVTGRPTLFFCQ
jgi:phosphoribosylformylglycinamidine synthase